jgi:hypothetical protein
VRPLADVTSDVTRAFFVIPVSSVSFRQACLNVFCMIASVVVFRIQEDDHGWTKTSRDSGGSDTRAGSL